MPSHVTQTKAHLKTARGLHSVPFFCGERITADKQAAVKQLIWANKHASHKGNSKNSIFRKLRTGSGEKWNPQMINKWDKCLNPVLKVFSFMCLSVPGMVSKWWVINQQVLWWVGGSWVNESHRCVKDADTHVRCVNNYYPPFNQLIICYRIGDA